MVKYSMTSKTEIAILGGGCFWCTEAIFNKIRGVESVVSGYAGGQKTNPTYQEVSYEETGHAEVIKIEYNPEEISYEELLDIFWHLHDPTTLNQQGADHGTQYRSIVLYTTDKQKDIAEKTKESLGKSGDYEDPIVTEVTKFDGKFYTAEEYHQQFFQKNEGNPYCQIVIAPKIKKLLEKYGKMVKN